LNSSAVSSWTRPFSHLYVEHAAFDYPLTRRLLERFPQARVVRIADYKGVFARPRQHFQTQKGSMKLVLAVKKDHFLYPGSDHSQGCGFDNFFYNTLMFNCVYNCGYCYLQGMYPSANLTAFVNLEDYFAETRRAVAERRNPAQPLYVCISYDTDLLAFESVLPYCRTWIAFAHEQPDLVIELRTKSAAYRAVRDLEPTGRVILAWTLSPGAVAARYEHGAPPLPQRLRTVQAAIADGWPVRLCFDPVLAIPDWQAAYGALVEETFRRIDPASVRDVTVGVFRMTDAYFDRLRRQRRDLDLVYDPYERQNGTVTYPAARRREIADYMQERLSRFVPAERMAVWA
jgi:spore photoproduct lyase